ncbi:MAG: TraI/MobA(P) family conjugative relaxase [Nitrosospira sp.]
MIAKRIDTKAKTSHFARLAKYVTAAQGGIDPRSWTRTATYVLDSGISSRGEKVGGVRVSNCNTSDPAAATTLIECTQSANTRSRTDKTYHLIFSFPPGEEPDLKTLNAIEDRLVASIGYADHQRISAVHIDTDHLHVHVAINKVHPTGYQNIEPYYDKMKLMETCERLELEYGLTRTNHGLTGEIKRERHREIRLGPEPQHDLPTHDLLRKSHILALAERDKGRNNHGMPKLPGGDVAYIERRYSELLPGDARNRVLKQRTKHADGLRWARDGAGRTGTGINSKASQGEAHSGIESLAGFVGREIAPSLKNAADWQQAHAILAEHGLQIKPRGAGLVIGSDNVWVRASQCDRGLSIKSLTDRLGEFQSAAQIPEKSFVPTPKHSHPSSAVLFDQYQRQREKHKLVREYGLEQVKYEGKVLEANLQTWANAQRRLVKLADKGMTRRALLKIVKLQTDATRKRNWQSLEPKRKKVLAETAFPTWVAWLAQQSGNGNHDALAVLRSRETNRERQGDTITAENAEHVIVQAFKPVADLNGSLTYRTPDGGFVIDRKTHVQSLRTTSGAALLALELASKRFKGQSLIIEGTAEFKREVTRLAAVHKIELQVTQQHDYGMEL